MALVLLGVVRLVGRALVVVVVVPLMVLMQDMLQLQRRAVVGGSSCCWQVAAGRRQVVLVAGQPLLLHLLVQEPAGRVRGCEPKVACSATAEAAGPRPHDLCSES